jgi:hypothetical protein
MAETYSAGGYGVYASNEFEGSTVNYGIFGKTKSASGIGVKGAAVAETEVTYGVQGLVNSNLGIGIWGIAMSNSVRLLG